MEDSSDKSIAAWFKAHKPLLILLAIPLMCTAIILGWRIHLEAPRFIVLDIPNPSEYGTGYSKIVHVQPGGLDRTYIWNQTQTVTSDNSGLKSLEEVGEYYDNWLITQGWERAAPDFYICLTNPYRDYENIEYEYYLPYDYYPDSQYPSRVLCVRVVESVPGQQFEVEFETKRTEFLGLLRFD